MADTAPQRDQSAAGRPDEVATYWYTPDGDGYPSREHAILVYRANNGDRDPAWIQRADETRYPPEAVAPQGGGE